MFIVALFCNRAEAVFSNRAQRNTPVIFQATTQTAVAAEAAVATTTAAAPEVTSVTYSYAGTKCIVLYCECSKFPIR